MPSHTGSQISGYCTQLVIDDGVSGARKDREDQVLGNEFRRKKKARVKEVQKLVGLLNHAAKVVRGGRTFFEKDDRLPERKTKEPLYQVDPRVS